MNLLTDVKGKKTENRSMK